MTLRRARFSVPSPANIRAASAALQEFLIGPVDKAIDFPAPLGNWAARALKWSTHFAMGAK
jgi:hypothetical protein